MCKAKRYKRIPNTRIDKCMIRLIDLINICTKYKTVSCCCGHKKYPMTVILRTKSGYLFELFSNAVIPRKRNIYTRDKQGYYYIREVQESIKKSK